MNVFARVKEKPRSLQGVWIMGNSDFRIGYYIFQQQPNRTSGFINWPLKDTVFPFTDPLGHKV